MGTAVLELPRDVCAPSAIGSLGAFFETSSAPEEANLGRKEERLIAGLLSALDTYLLDAVSARSVSEFSEKRENVWPKYVRALRALQDTMSNLVPEPIIEHMSKDAIAELDSDFKKQGQLRFGSTLADQATFTLWTIGKIRSLGREISAAGNPPAEMRDPDLDLLRQYHVSSLWAQFHLDILVAAMKFDRPISEDIRESICDGLRAVVNAYAIMKDALALRLPHSEEPAIANLPWDEEDERLLASSMRDVNVKFAEDC